MIIQLAERGKIMKIMSVTMLSLMITGTQALASAGGANVGGMGLLATFFIAFAVLIVLFQFLPGMALFVSMLKGIFASEPGKPVQEAVKNNRTNL